MGKLKRIIVAPDSFKGTMSAVEICNIADKTIKRFLPDAEITGIPIADGGEGTVEAFLSCLGGRVIEKEVTGPMFEKLTAAYGILKDNKTAVIELAAASGLPLVKGKPNPLNATTYGTGELIKDAVESGCDKIILGLGGSATNDGGIGIMNALGIKYKDCFGNELKPTGESLEKIASFDLGNFDSEKYNGVSITVACDVANPLTGSNGAACVFGPQKGADESAVIRLDLGLNNYNKVLEKATGKNRNDIPGMGAAGGCCLSLDAFFNVEIKPGIELVLDMAGFDSLLGETDMVLTGEGKIDSQSLEGKVPVGVARRAKEKGVPVIVIAGDIGDGYEAMYDEGITALFSTNRQAVPYEKAKLTAKEDYILALESLMRFYLSMP